MDRVTWDTAVTTLVPMDPNGQYTVHCTVHFTVYYTVQCTLTTLYTTKSQQHIRVVLQGTTWVVHSFHIVHTAIVRHSVLYNTVHQSTLL